MPDDDFSDGAGADVDSAPDVGTPQPGPPPILGAPSAAPPAPPGHLFKSIISSLGIALAQGVQAGVQAPMSPQGPPIAAANAAAAPQREFEQRMANQKAVKDSSMDDMTIAMTQLKMHQLQMITSKMDEDRQNEAYNTSRDTLKDFIDKGKVDILSTGSYEAVNQMLIQKQKEASAEGQGLLPLHVFAAPGSTAKNPEYSLVSVGKEKLTDNMNETWGADDLKISDEDFKAAGLTQGKFHAGIGMDQQKALLLKANQYLAWQTKSEQILGQYKRNQATIAARASEGKKNRDVRMGIAELNNSTRRALAVVKDAQAKDPKLFADVIKAGNMLGSSNKALAAAQGKIANKAWDELGGGETREVAGLRRKRDSDQAIFDQAVAKMQGGAPATAPTAVPKGTVATKAIAQQYLQKFGGNVANARAAMKTDGYTIPPAQKAP